MARLNVELETLREKLSHFAAMKDLSKTIPALEAQVTSLNAEVCHLTRDCCSCCWFADTVVVFIFFGDDDSDDQDYACC